MSFINLIAFFSIVVTFFVVPIFKLRFPEIAAQNLIVSSLLSFIALCLEAFHFYINKWEYGGYNHLAILILTAISIFFFISGISHIAVYGYIRDGSQKNG